MKDFVGSRSDFVLPLSSKEGKGMLLYFRWIFSLQLGDRLLSYPLAGVILIGVFCVIAAEEGTKDGLGDEIVLV